MRHLIPAEQPVHSDWIGACVGPLEYPPDTEEPPVPTEAERSVAAWFDMFGHAYRVALLRALATGEKTANELAKAIGAEVPNCKLHIAKLKAAGLVTTRHIGYRKCYALASVTRTATALEFTHPSGARVVAPVDEAPAPPVGVHHDSEEELKRERAGE